MFQAVENDSPRLERGSVVCTEACNQGFRGVRAQDNCVVGPRRSYRSYHWTSEMDKDLHDPDEATWELEGAMRLAHPFLFNFLEHQGQCQCIFLFNFVKH